MKHETNGIELKINLARIYHRSGDILSIKNEVRFKIVIYIFS